MRSLEHVAEAAPNARRGHLDGPGGNRATTTAAAVLLHGLHVRRCLRGRLAQHMARRQACTMSGPHSQWMPGAWRRRRELSGECEIT